MHSLSAAAFGASLALLAASVSAHGDHPHGPRSGGTPTLHIAKRATTATNWQAEASITKPADECSPYYIEEVNALISSYPEIWEIATIPSTDTYASSMFAAMQTGIPSISPKGTSDGDFSSVTYDENEDPDCWWTSTKCGAPKHSGIPADIDQCPEPKTWGLTFDDGPNCTHNAFYDYLAENNQKATMFYIGSNVMDWPLQAQRGLADGHHILGHTWSHRYMTSLTDEQVFAELYYSSKAIKDIMGISVEAWRPPYGDVDDRVRYIATQLGLRTIIWSADTDDWDVEPSGTMTEAQIDALYQQIIGNVSTTTGNIVLTHEINQDTMDLFMEQYPNIQAAFDHIVPLTACMNWTKPYAEDITYPDFADYVAGTTTPSGVSSTMSFASASYSPYLGGGSSVVVNEGYASQATATSSSSANSTKKNSSKSTSSKSAGSSGSTGTSSSSTSAAAEGLARPFAGLAVAAAAVFGGTALMMFL